jgi:hypothetical protein
MNYLVFLDPQAGELEKILSGTKSMILRKTNPALPCTESVARGDSLYFLKNNGDCTLRVRATVVRVVPSINGLGEDLSRTLKELQPKLQLTEDQYNYWSVERQVLLVEFETAHKIAVIHVAPEKVTDRSDWIAFKELGQIT